MSALGSLSRVRVFNSTPSTRTLPNPVHSDSDSNSSDSDSDDGNAPTHRERNGDIVLSMKELKISMQSEMHMLMVKGCRGTSSGGLPKTSARDCDVLHCPPDCTCSDCPRCVRRNKRRHRNRGHGSSRHPSLRDLSLAPGPSGPTGDITPSAAYLRASAVPSKPTASDHPLVVLSLDMVLDARLPYHLSGGYTDVISRPYIHTLLDYILHLHSPWSVCFFTSLPRKVALKTLKQLKLPTGGPEKDERDGVVGVFAHEDMRRGWSGGELEVKDLEFLWDKLEEEEGIRWTLQDTVVLTDNPAHMRAQPHNFILVPKFSYRSTVAAADDQFLLMMVAALKDLETETNFAYHIKEMGWFNSTFWQSANAAADIGIPRLAMYVFWAVRICAQSRVDIVAYGGN
ncbi:hypothetical protein BCR35DRAFT_327301 [Leucosporidium creatinivorum]|uniref:FCP1 homology domain-containing protein n=1 Tax=Leucosporidium creatinivorum TaxID=106004 RepID=A0A1Y2CN10_9BASI|nr:hypothetical protein BCR35DRAFT_327301 [Leucosporidium creatinivorum]